jgi:hypothetical protein
MPVPLYLSGVVKILVFLDLAKTISFLDGHYLKHMSRFFKGCQYLNKSWYSDFFPLLQRGIEGDFLIKPGLFYEFANPINQSTYLVILSKNPFIR